MKKRILIQYAVYGALGLVAALLSASSRDLWSAGSVQEVCGILTDAFTVPGVFFSGAGGLSWIASKGNFMIFRYGFSTLISRFTHPKEKMMPYYEYTVKRNAERKPWLKQVFITGLVFLSLAGICLVVYFVI